MIDLHISGNTMEEVLKEVNSLAVPTLDTPVGTDVVEDNPPPPVIVTDDGETAPLPPSQSAAAATAGGEVELDKEGYSWDERIHAKTKTKTAKEIWKRKKGIDDALYASVRAETIPATLTPEQIKAAADAKATAAADAKATAAADAAVGGEVIDMTTIMKKAGEVIQSGKIDAPGINALLQTIGIENVPGILQHPDKFNDVNTLLCNIA